MEQPQNRDRGTRNNRRVSAVWTLALVIALLDLIVMLPTANPRWLRAYASWMVRHRILNKNDADMATQFLKVSAAHDAATGIANEILHRLAPDRRVLIALSDDKQHMQGIFLIRYMLYPIKTDVFIGNVPEEIKRNYGCRVEWRSDVDQRVIWQDNLPSNGSVREEKPGP